MTMGDGHSGDPGCLPADRQWRAGLCHSLPARGGDLDAVHSASFEAVLDFIQFALFSARSSPCSAFVKLRVTHPELPRPYRAWGYR